MLLGLVWAGSSAQAMLTHPVTKAQKIGQVSTPGSGAVTLSPTPLVSPKTTEPQTAETVWQKVIVSHFVTPSLSPSQESEVQSQEVAAVPLSKVTASPLSQPSLTPTSLPVVSTTPWVQVPTPSPQSNLIHYTITGLGVSLMGDSTEAGKTVGEATQAIARKHATTFMYEVSSMGWFVTELAGVKQNTAKGQYWLYYINGQFAEKGVDQVILQPGDTLTWKYGN